MCSAVEQFYFHRKNGKLQKRGKVNLVGRLQLSTERSKEEDNESIVQLRILRVQVRFAVLCQICIIFLTYIKCLLVQIYLTKCTVIIFSTCHNSHIFIMLHMNLNKHLKSQFHIFKINSNYLTEIMIFYFYFCSEIGTLYYMYKLKYIKSQSQFSAFWKIHMGLLWYTSNYCHAVSV